MIRCRAYLRVAFLLALLLAPSLPAAAQSGTCGPPGPPRIHASGFELPGGQELASAGAFATATITGVTTRQGRVTAWVAHHPVAASTRPLVLFVPGVQIPSASYRSLANHLASWGFVVVRVDLPGQGPSADHVEMALDLRAVLDSVLAPAALPVPVDATRIAVSGHGLGGKLALMAAASDSRFRAILVLDPLNAGGPSGYDAAHPNIVPQPMGAIALPIGFVGELVDSVPGSGGFACAPAAINHQVLYNASSATPSAIEWTIGGAAHLDFVTDVDQCGLACTFCTAGSRPAAQTHAFVRAVSVAWFRTHLENQSSYCPWLTGAQVPGAIDVRLRP